jgi:hypothetical protein
MGVDGVDVADDQRPFQIEVGDEGALTGQQRRVFDTEDSGTDH